MKSWSLIGMVSSSAQETPVKRGARGIDELEPEDRNSLAILGLCRRPTEIEQETDAEHEGA